MLAGFYGLGKELEKQRMENDSHLSKSAQHPSEEKIVASSSALGPTEKIQERYKSTDSELKLSVMGQLYEDIDFSYNKACKYDRKCADRPGFNSFMAELRRSFWGKSWERAPSSKERRTKMYRMLQRAHCGKDHIKFFKFSYIIESK